VGVTALENGMKGSEGKWWYDDRYESNLWFSKPDLWKLTFLR
jgi:hypothetical protein